ncbi:hypothetical protein PR048_019362 [Dryococelus australis]|uniref:Reverse transcriptase domain-containing protein n=1 Tax=Dryococelus australis TaxID=614101 RepID=A0ABQ9H395_9NEOP|nr:hypothetical protein PR048_019362 [Dryococelus australis]
MAECEATKQVKEAVARVFEYLTRGGQDVPIAAAFRTIITEVLLSNDVVKTVAESVADIVSQKFNTEAQNDVTQKLESARKQVDTLEINLRRTREEPTCVFSASKKLLQKTQMRYFYSSLKKLECLLNWRTLAGAIGSDENAMVHRGQLWSNSSATGSGVRCSGKKKEKNLKNTGVTIREDLTAAQLQVLQESIRRFGMKKIGLLSTRDYKICHLNISSLIRNRDNTRDIITENDVYMFLLSLKCVYALLYHLHSSFEQIGQEIVQVEEFVYVSNMVSVKRLDICNIVGTTNNTGLEQLWIEIAHKHQKFAISVLYKPPDVSYKELDYIENVLESLIPFYDNIINLGDFNIKMLKPTSDVKYVTEIISTSGFKQLVSSPTRITLTSETPIDLIFIKDDSSVSHCAQNSLLGFTDHNMIYLSLSLGSPIAKKQRDAAKKNYRASKLPHYCTLYKELRSPVTKTVDKDIPDSLKLPNEIDNYFISSSKVAELTPNASNEIDSEVIAPTGEFSFVKTLSSEFSHPTEFKHLYPISILPVMPKIIERIVHTQLLNYLNANKLLYDRQSGFRSCPSTYTAFIYKSMDEGKITFAIFIDVTKAFDTINH